MTESDRINQIWRQNRIPVLWRMGKGISPRLRLPYREDNRAWIQNGRRTNIRWDRNEKYWEIPQSWFNDLVERCVEEFDKVYIIQPFREQEKCAPACWNATGYECQCSCMGENHGAGGGSGRWTVISDTFATRWGQETIACRLLSK
jgi:hypothetical protein